MSQIITYQNNNRGTYCQLKLDDGTRIFISIARTGIQISKMKLGGLIPGAKLLDISTADLHSPAYAQARLRLSEKSLAFNYLDVMVEILKPLASLEQVQSELDRIFS